MLADRAIERGPAGLDKALNRGLAAWAGLAFTSVDAECVLKIAQRAIGLAVIAEGGAAGVDGFGQDGADDGKEAGNFSVGKVCAEAGWG